MRYRYPGLLLPSLREGCPDKPERSLLQLIVASGFLSIGPCSLQLDIISQLQAFQAISRDCRENGQLSLFIKDLSTDAA